MDITYRYYWVLYLNNVVLGFYYVGKYAYDLEDVRFVKLQEYSVGQCIECACCSYVCPAHKPLMESNKQGKRFVKKYKAAHAEGGK